MHYVNTILQVVHSGDDYGRSGLATLTSIAHREKVCIFSSAAMTQASDANSVARNVSLAATKVVVLYMGTNLMSAFLEVNFSLPCIVTTFSTFVYLALL